MSEQQYIGYGKYWDTTIGDDEVDIWISVFVNGDSDLLIWSKEIGELRWLGDLQP